MGNGDTDAIVLSEEKPTILGAMIREGNIEVVDIKVISLPTAKNLTWLGQGFAVNDYFLKFRA